MAPSKSTKSQTTTNNEDSKGALSGIVLAPGQVITGIDKAGKQANYVIRNYLGEGWTAVVYAGMNMDSKQQQHVALKVLRPNSDELTEANFRGEKEILDEIRAQNVTCVPEVYGLFANAEQNLEFIAMEFVSESDYPRLDNILEFQGLLNEEDVLEISRQAVTLLDRLHTRVNRTYTDMQLKDFCWNAPARKLMVIDWNHVSFERAIIEAGKQNNPSVKQQLQARGAEDFDGLARLDVRRFATYIYTLLTGKQVLEVGETSWGLKARAGGHWDRISESVRLIIFKALVSYPGLQPYQSAAELLKDLESAIALAKRKDIEHLTDELGMVLDEVEDNDGIADTDEQINDWVPQRLEKINRASALLDQVRSLPEAQDLILQKRLTRYEERITSLFDGVPDNWSTGQRYFDVEQYLTALDLWEPLAEKRQTVHLWRQILLARAASENSNFSSMKDYLIEALKSLKSGKIDDALLQFKSGTLGRETSGALASLEAEIEALQNIKKASEARSFNEVEALLKKTEYDLKEREIPYVDILMRDPVWFGYVGSWLSDKDKDVFALLGKADIFAVIRNRLSLLRVQASAEEDEKKEFNDNRVFVKQLFINPHQEDLASLKNRLWAKPDDETLFKAICHEFEHFDGLEENKEEQEKLLLNIRPVFCIALQWGAPSEGAEKKLKRHLRLLDVLIYTNELDTSIANGVWDSAEEAARRLALLGKKDVEKNGTVKRLEEKFWKQAETYKEMVTGSSLIEIFNPGIDDLVHLSRVLNILIAPNIDSKRKTLIDKISEKRSQQEEIEKEFQVRENRIEMDESQIRGEKIKLRKQSASLEAERTKLSIKADLIAAISKEIINKDESNLSDYRNMINIINGHIQEVRSQYQSPTPDLEGWLKTWTNYKKDLEETMKQQRLFTEFKQSLRNCVLAVAVWNQDQAKNYLNGSEEKLNQLTSEYALMGRDLYDNTSNVLGKLGDNKTEFDNLKAEAKNFEISNDNQDIKKLQEMRQQCNELLRTQLEHAGKLADIFPQFTYLGLNSLDRQINNLELRYSLKQITKTNLPASPTDDVGFPQSQEPSEDAKTIQSDGVWPSQNSTANPSVSTPSNILTPDDIKPPKLVSSTFFSSTTGRVVLGILALLLCSILVWGAITLSLRLAPPPTPTFIAQTTETFTPTATNTLAVTTTSTITPTLTLTPTPESSQGNTIFIGTINPQPGKSNVTYRYYPDTQTGEVITYIARDVKVEIVGVTDPIQNASGQPMKWYLSIFNNADGIDTNNCGWIFVDGVLLAEDINLGDIPIISKAYDTKGYTSSMCGLIPVPTPTITYTSTPTSTFTSTPTSTLTSTPTPTTKP